MLLVEGLSVVDLESRKAVFWAVLKDVPEGPSKHSRVCGAFSMGFESSEGWFVQEISAIDARSTQVVASGKCMEVSRELQQIIEGLNSQIPCKLLKPRNSIQEFTCILGAILYERVLISPKPDLLPDVVGRNR